MIKGLSKAMSVAFVSNKFLLIPSKYSFHIKKKVTCHCPLSTKHEIVLLLKLNQFYKSGGTLSSSEPVTAHSDCSRLGNTLCLCLPV